MLERGMKRSRSPATAESFAADLARRERAAQGLEQDLLTDVPLLYGSPGSLEASGDPGIVLAEIHREDMLRRNGGGLSPSSTGRSDDALPFERATAVLGVLLFLISVWGSLD